MWLCVIFDGKVALAPGGCAESSAGPDIGLQLRQYQRFGYGERIVSTSGLKRTALVDPFKVAFSSEPVSFADLKNNQKQPALQHRTHH